MRLDRLQVATLFIAALAGCGGAGVGTPAEAQTPPFKVTPVASFDTPWAMTTLPGTTNALVTEKDGKLWLVSLANGTKQAVTGVPKVRVAGQGGLGDVVLHPQFAANRRVYLSFVEAGSNGTAGAALGYGTLEGTPAKPRIDNFKVVWRQSPKVDGNGHFSHRIAFGPDGAMFVTSGDRQKFTPAQDTAVNLGKVLRLTPEGAPWPGNPWASKGGIAATFWTIGHRNLLGIAFAPDGRLWEHEMGPKGGDEVNLITPGKNYGWPVVSNGDNYDGSPIPDHPTRPEFEAPKVSWNPVISPAGLIVYTGALFPAWKGDILMGGLSSEALIRIDVNGDRASKANQWSMNARIREVEQGPRGEVYLLEDSGRLLRLEPA